MINILEMDREEILAIRPEAITRFLNLAEVAHIFKTLGAFWQYDYEAAGRGRVVPHAELKSGRHSDGFFASKIILEPENVRRIIAQQMVWRIKNEKMPKPDYVVGIPNGATILGKEIADLLGTPAAKMRKNAEGFFVFETKLPRREIVVLLVEDVCTEGTAFKQAVLEIKRSVYSVKILPWNPVIINRGRLKEVFVNGVGAFKILPVAEIKMTDWKAGECILCESGSKAIKPKETDEAWSLITASQS